MATRAGNLTIALGQTESNALGPEALRLAKSLALFAPATMPETVTVQAAPSDAPAAGDWRVLQSAGADIVLTAGKATVISDVPIGALRVVASVGVAAQRVIAVTVSEVND